MPTPRALDGPKLCIGMPQVFRIRRRNSPGMLMDGQLEKYLENWCALRVADIRITFRSFRDPVNRSRRRVIKKSDKTSRS